MKNNNFEEVVAFAEAVVKGERKSIVDDGFRLEGEELVLAAQRFLDDIENTDKYWIDYKAPEFCIQIIETTLKHQQGENLAGEPMRGKPYLLEVWHKFIIYNLVGIKIKGTDICKYHEALIYIPRKNTKTTFAAALSWALVLLYRKSGSKMYIASAALMQSLESFSFLKYNVIEMGEWDKHGGSIHINDNFTEHSLSSDFGDGGSMFIKALAANPDKQDSLNCNLAIVDEMHAFTKPKQYNLFKEAMKAYTNKLIIGISTAGDDEQLFLGQRLKYARKVLKKIVADDQFFIFMCCAPKSKNGDVDYTNQKIQEMANPNYGITIRPEEMYNEGIQAQNDPQQRKDYLAKSLNVFTSSLRSYFNIDEFRASDEQYNWTLEELAKMPIKWYGGADLSKLHDLTASALMGMYGDVVIIITHGFFPITAAHLKADEDNIPLFGWADNGWLTMSNNKTVNHQEVVDWFVKTKEMGYNIAQVGHDKKFCREYFLGMKLAGFKIIDQPQVYYRKSEGFRFIEQAAKNGKLYYLHSEAYEYCVENVHAIEKADDAIMYEKVMPKHRIDLFDASVFATCRFLENMAKTQNAKKWLED